jgi:hypothetical protein
LDTGALHEHYLQWRRRSLRAAEDSRTSAAVNTRWFLIVVSVILGIILLSPVCSVLTYLCPVYAVIFGWALLRTSRTSYISFTLWLWFFSPLVMRLVDYRSGAGVHTLILATPYFASCVPLYEIVSGGEQVFNRRAAPLLLMTAAVLCGFAVGMFHYNIAAVMQVLLLWMAPLCFAFFIFQNRAHFLEMFRAFEVTMIYGSIVAAAYGIYQYFELPNWDALWMQNQGNETFFVAAALQVRVFSSMNAPQVLALFLSVGLLLALNSHERIRFVAAPVIALGLALTMARTAWISFLIGLAYLALRGNSRLRAQVIASAAIVFVLFGVALQDPEIAMKVSQRFGTLNNVKNDDSVVDRLQGHEALFKFMGDWPMGIGVGGQNSGNDTVSREGTIKVPSEITLQQDSSLSSMLLTLGFGGTILAVISFLMVTRTVVHLDATKSSPTGVLKVLMVVFLAEAPCQTVLNGPCGFLCWAVVGLCLAGEGYRFQPAARSAWASRRATRSGRVQKVREA